MKKRTIKLNLGCGSHIMAGKEWINVDNYLLYEGDKSKNFVQADIRKLPFETGSIDYIFCDQVVEHIAYKDVPTVFYEISRVLKKGGKAIIIVPDFQAVVQQWLDIQKDSSFDPVTYHYFSEVVYGNQYHEGEFHKSAISAGYLNYVLNMVGLVEHKISVFPAFSEIPLYEGIRPHPPKALYRNGNLVAEIIKR